MKHKTIQDLVNKAVKVEKIAIADELEGLISDDSLDCESRLNSVGCFIKELREECNDNKTCG